MQIITLLYTKRKMQIFYKTILGNATDVANVCQMISYSSLEKDLICNENLNLNLE